MTQKTKTQEGLVRPSTSLGVYKRLVLPRAGRGIFSGGIAMGKAPTGL